MRFSDFRNHVCVCVRERKRERDRERKKRRERGCVRMCERENESEINLYYIEKILLIFRSMRKSREAKENCIC